MGLFSSKRERSLHRDIEIKKGIARIKRQIKTLDRSESEWATKALKARSIDSALPRSMLKKTVQQHRMLERQLLLIESALQMKNQMETFEEFANSMSHVAKSMELSFKDTDLIKTQEHFESAITNAKTFEQMMDIFVTVTSDTMGDGELTDNQEVSDEDIDELLLAYGGKPLINIEPEKLVEAE